MRRDYIIVVGNQGFGKSAWTMTYGRSQDRLLCFDPKGEYPVNFRWENEEMEAVIEGRAARFRFGSFMPEELELLANAAYGATRCTLILEECAFLFERGERLSPWAHRVIYMGREPELNLVLVAQRANAIPIDIRSQASRVITFFQSEPEDCDALAKRIGRQYRDEIAQLPMLTCLDWEAGKVSRYAIAHPGKG